MPQGAGLIMLLAVIAMFVVSAHDDPHYKRVTGKETRPGCPMLTLTDLDTDPDKVTTLCVPATDFARYRVGDRFTGTSN